MKCGYLHNFVPLVDIEKFLKDEDQSGSAQGGAKKSPLTTSPRDGFSQWSSFGPCSSSCGNGFQTRSRRCLPSRACLGTTKESRACILAPCAGMQYKSIVPHLHYIFTWMIYLSTCFFRVVVIFNLYIPCFHCYIVFQEPMNCIQTSGGNSAGKCCAMPFIFQDTVYDKCITHAGTGGLWCATSPNYDSDKSWGFCKVTGRKIIMKKYEIK